MAISVEIRSDEIGDALRYLVPIACNFFRLLVPNSLKSNSFIIQMVLTRAMHHYKDPSLTVLAVALCKRSL